ncbi:hypothetical protein CDV31_015293 [Fusarium ambrosium]|uniref:Sacsin/Nov domain-containing protein n=1 Tax=Fusarium ambrosium TaxID=131363 RepID=A0A428SQT2_9HYPO|nr:hypothetical protein CDV31_015293 [Fusarium ambrosium]
MDSDETPQSESSRARDFIAELGGKNGFVEKKYWDELSEAGRAKFQRAISSLQGELEPAIKTLAQSLYSSTGRFVFELLQNAEDCNFDFAKRGNESPYISFHLSEDHLVIECNEDGFTKTDLEAICSIGKSSKSATKGYIGEKGIGFKSVFMAAWKVHIQSGPYSFYFKHHEDGSKTSTIFSKSQADDCRIKILKTVTQDDSDKPESSSTLFHITKHQVHNLSKNENRTYSEKENRRKEYSTAEVILAFPLTPEYEPVIESHEIFAFLPVQAAGFPFLIQSDFVTNASRQHIVTTARRNVGLRDAISDAFIEAALEFCNHETLQYTWMEFLPDKNKVYSDFWSVLVTNIETNVRETPLVRPDSGGPLRLIRSLRILRSALADEENNLLLRDFTLELRISRHYGRSSLAILQNLGLVKFYWNDFIRMVDQDLQSSDSWIKFRVSDGFLQIRIANLLQDYYTNTKWNRTRSMIEKLPIIPLQDGRWLAATGKEKIFFPDTSGRRVPEGLEFNLVESSAASQSERRKLFETLRVESLSVRSVRERIFKRHKSYWENPGKSIQFYAQQLKFLYSTHDRKTHHKDDYCKVVLIDDGCIQTKSTSSDIYLPDDNPLGPQELLRPIGNRMLDLQGTYLPFSDLQSQCNRFLAGKADFPFLQLEQPIERQDYDLGSVSLANYLGVGSREDISFYLAILRAFRTVKRRAKADSHRVFELYSVIHGRCLQSKTMDIDKGYISLSFNVYSMVFVPSEDEGESVWVPLSDCLWEAPPCMRSKHPLKARMQSFLTEFVSLTSFFVDILDVPNCDYSHILRELQYLSDKGDPEVEDISSLYSQLSIMIQKLPAIVQRNIKSAFVNRRLIYAEKGGCGGWHQVAECLWASEIDLPGWAIVEPHYQDLENFFVEFLGVKTLSLELVYNELDRLGSSSDTTREEIEPTIWSLNSYLSAGVQPPDAKKLLDRRIFPVRYPDGHVQLEKATVEFAIVDREQLGDIFKPRAKTLDFDLDQVRMLEPTLTWLGLGERYLSEAVQEVSRVQSPSKEPLSTPERSIKPRAHALYRIAYHYNSPRLIEWDTDFYDFLITALVYETDGIAATLSLNQDGREICYEKADILEEEGIAAGEFEDDYEEVEEPEEAQAAEETQATGESRATEETDEIGESHVEESHVVEDVASSSDGDPIVTPALTETEAEETPSLTASDSSQPAAPVRQETPDGPSFAPSNINLGVATGSPARRQPTRSRRFSSSDITEDVGYLEARSDFATTRNQPTVQPIPAVPVLTDRETTQYQALLERVVSAARGSPRLPSQGAYDMTGMSHALSDLMGDSGNDEVDQFPRFRSSSQYERDRKIGAAGELYVFELLKNLSPGLPGFSLENWRSTIRRYASAHPDYANIGRWNHRETSDIEYDDSEGALTELMIDNGYLERDIWEDRKPRYYLEVKTTTGRCEAPFYMSKSQYRLMHECQDSTDKIYVVFRVYEVEKIAVQLRVYVNPAKLEGSGRLIYTAETWSVRPGA